MLHSDLGYLVPVRRLAAAALVLLTACVGPARSFNSYRGKAGATAADMVSAVETGRVAVETAMRGRAFAPYLSVVLSEAEDDASAIQGTFDSIQPPDPRSDQLRSQLDDLMTPAVSSLSDLRIAARRGEFARLPSLAESLAKLSDQLNSFAEANS